MELLFDIAIAGYFSLFFGAKLLIIVLNTVTEFRKAYSGNNRGAKEVS